MLHEVLCEATGHHIPFRMPFIHNSEFRLFITFHSECRLFFLHSQFLSSECRSFTILSSVCLSHSIQITMQFHIREASGVAFTKTMAIKTGARVTVGKNSTNNFEVQKKTPYVHHDGHVIFENVDGVLTVSGKSHTTVNGTQYTAPFGPVLVEFGSVIGLGGPSERKLMDDPKCCNIEVLPQV